MPPPTKRQRQATAAPAVVSLGITVLDYSITLDNFPVADSKQVARRQSVSGGGNAANTAVACSRLGVKTRLVSKVAEDAPGRVLLAELEAEEVDCRGVQISDSTEGSTVTCFVLVTGAERTTVSMPYSQRVPDLAPSWVDRHFGSEGTCGGDSDLLAGAGMLQLDGRHARAGARAAEIARARGVPVLVEAELRGGAGTDEAKQQARQDLFALLRQADYVVTSTEFASSQVAQLNAPQHLAPSPGFGSIDTVWQTRLADWVTKYAPHCKLAVVTLGADGCFALERVSPGEETRQSDGITTLQQEKQQPPPPQPPPQLRWHNVPAFAIAGVVDSTGAGDAFIGGLAAAIVRGLPILSALRVAAWVGAMNCLGEGARGGMPCLRASAAALSSMPPQVRADWLRTQDR